MKKTKCPHCGEKVEKGTRFCVNCGASLLEGGVAAGEENTTAAVPERVQEVESFSPGRPEAEPVIEPEEKREPEMPEYELPEPEPEEKAEPEMPEYELPEQEPEEKAEPEMPEYELSEQEPEEKPEPEVPKYELPEQEPEEKPEPEVPEYELPEPEPAKPFYSEPVNPEPIPVSPVPMSPAPEEKPGKVKKTRTRASFGKVLASLFFCLLILITGIGASLTYFVRQATTKEAVENTVDELELGYINAGCLTYNIEEDTLLQEYLANAFNRFFEGKVKEKNVRRLLEEDFVKEFVADKLWDYVQDVLGVTGDGTIEIEEIEELFSDNWKRIKRVLDVENITIDGYTDSEARQMIIGEMTELIEDDLDFDAVSVPKLRRRNDTAFTAARIFLSYPAVYGMAALCLVLMILLIVMNFRYRGGFRYVGSCLIIIGIVDILVAEAAVVLPGVLNAVLPLGYGFYTVCLSNFIVLPLMVGAGALLFGIIFTLIGRKLRRGYKRKLKAANAAAAGNGNAA